MDRWSRVHCIIQARMTSQRLPGKVLADIEGQTMLERVVGRVQRAAIVERIIVATSVRASDDPVIDECRRHGWLFSRGSEDDVLSRYWLAAVASSSNVIVRVTADCPLIDPGLIDALVQRFCENEVDYAANFIPYRTYPRGLDVEVISRQALKAAHRMDPDPRTREHVTPYIRGHPGMFPQVGMQNVADYSSFRWTVDEEADLELVRRIYSELRGDEWTWMDVVEIMGRRPEWLQINRHVQQKSI